MNQAATGSSAWSMYRALVGIGCACSLLIVTVYLLTGPVIAHNRAVALQRAIFSVLPATSSAQALHRDDSGTLRLPTAGESEDLYLGFDAQGAVTGVAIEGSGMGYQDVIRLIYGYSPATGRIIGMRVLESRETPGLGDKIIIDDDFVSAFDALEIPLSADGSQVLHPVRAIKAGDERQDWEIDSITGATISSRAVAKIIAESSAEWVPLVQRQREHLDEIEQKPEAKTDDNSN